MLNSLMLLSAMSGIHEEDVVMAGKIYINEQKTKHFKPNRIITIALAAALILALGATAYAVYRGSMNTRIPEEGTTDYHLLYSADPDSPEMLHVDFDRTKFAMSFDVPEDGRFPVFRASYLPGDEEGWHNSSFYEMLDKAKYFGLPWEMRQLRPDQVQVIPDETPEVLLAKAKMDSDTAKSWYTDYFYRGSGGDMAWINLYGGYKLHGKELILGAFAPEDTEVEVAREDSLGDCQLIEVQMNYPDGAVHRHLFLFQPEEYWLLQVSGAGDIFDFTALEKMAEGIDIFETQLEAKSYDDKIDFIHADLAAG